MADKKISEFPSGVPSNQGVMLQYELASERGGANYKLSLQDVMNLIGPNASTSPYSPYTFPQFAATTATISTLNVAGASTFGNAVNSGGGTGTLGQVLSSTGSLSAPKWIDNFPVGGIIIWGGSVANIPSGWQLCDGSNGTPDLRNRFVIGAVTDQAQTQYPVTTITGVQTVSGGSKDAYLVAHSHSATASSPPHQHVSGNPQDYTGQWGGADMNADYYQKTGTSTTKRSPITSPTAVSVSVSISTEGYDGINGRLPPYYALAYIMKTAYT